LIDIQNKFEMNIKINTIDKDEVINSYFLTGVTDYATSLNDLYPLIDRLDIQRKIQNVTFYKRLEQDILKGCIMPPITIAFVLSENEDKSLDEWESFIKKNIAKGFILDGIQRLNTLNRIKENEELDGSRPLFLNILICKSRDNLLYRMVTLNNGQKPMSARHQIEILAANIYDFESMPLKIVSEKEAKNKRFTDALRKADVISGYLAFLSNSIGLDSKKIIQSKMDELIAKRIIDSDITYDNIEFSDVLDEIYRLTKDNETNLKWFKSSNNLIGFSVGIKKSMDQIRKMTQEEFSMVLENFETAFKSLNISKIKVSTERKKLSKDLLENISKYKNLDADELLLEFSEIL
tara:strand:- start:1169 stop:2218 length:1050 start_codon:yes stop_codon:yes gene_type:complete